MNHRYIFSKNFPVVPMFTAYENGTKTATKEDTIFAEATSKESNYFKYIILRNTEILFGEDFWGTEIARSGKCNTSPAINEPVCECNVSTISTGCPQCKSSSTSNILLIHRTIDPQSNDRSSCSYQSTTISLIIRWFRRRDVTRLLSITRPLPYNYLINLCYHFSR